MSRPYSRPPFIQQIRPQFLATGHQGVPQDIVTDFFSALQTGDLDRIKEFEKRNGFNFNIQDTVGKEASKKTPFHVILELDSSIVKNSAKIQILEYLDRMGSPMDAPDANNIRPIHLAVQSQDLDLIKFFIDRNVSIQKADGQGNTPLHYAVMGKEIACPKPKKIGQLVPSEPLDKKNVNEKLKQIFDIIMILCFSFATFKLSVGEPSLNEYPRYITDYIKLIPRIYDEEPIEQQLIADIHEIFSTSILDKTYSGDPSSKKTAIDQLINRTYQSINDRLLRGLTKPLVIAPNSGGWGPRMPAPGGTRAPINVEKILVTDLQLKAAETKRNFDTKQKSMLEQIAATNTALSVRSLTNPMKDVENFMTTLLFNPENKENYIPITEYARTVLLTMLTWNHYKLEDYADTLAEKIIERYVAVNMIDIGYESEILLNHILDYQSKSVLVIDVSAYDIHENIPNPPPAGAMRRENYLTSGIPFSLTGTENFIKHPYKLMGVPPMSNFIPAPPNTILANLDPDILIRNQVQNIITSIGTGVAAAYQYKLPPPPAPPGLPPPFPLTYTDRMVSQAFTALLTDTSTRGNQKAQDVKYSIHSKISSAIGLHWKSSSVTTLHDTELNSPISSLANIKEYAKLMESYSDFIKKYGNRTWYQILKHLIQKLKPDYWVAIYIDNNAGTFNEVTYPAPWLFNSIGQIVDNRGNSVQIPASPFLGKYLDATNARFPNLGPQAVPVEYSSFGEYDLPILSQLPIYFSESDYNKKRVNFERRYTIIDAMTVTDWLLQYMLRYEYYINVVLGPLTPGSWYDQTGNSYYSIKHMNVLVDNISKLFVGGDMPQPGLSTNVPGTVNLLIKSPQTRSVFQRHVGSTIGDAFPEIIFLMKALNICTQRLIKTAVKEAITESISLHVVPPDTYSPAFNSATLRNQFNRLSYFSPMTTGHFYSSMMPFRPLPTTFNKEPFKSALLNKWSSDTSIAQAFKSIVIDIPSIEILLTEIRKKRPIITNTVNIGNSLREYRLFFKDDASAAHVFSTNPDDISKMINHPPFVTLANSFFKEISNEFIEILRNVDPALPSYLILNDISNDFAANLLKESTYYFRTYMVNLMRLLIEPPKEFNKLALVVGDIGRFIKEELYYYVPQVFLPALIKQILVVDGAIDENLNPVIDSITRLIFTLRDRIDAEPTNKHLKSLWDFGTELSGKLDTVFDPAFTIVESLIKLHNDVIDYLNFVAQSTILENSYKGETDPVQRGIFMMKLHRITPFKLGRKNKTSINEIKQIIETYRPPGIKTTYDHKEEDEGSVYFPMLANEQTKIQANNNELRGIFLNTASANLDSHATYRNIINFERDPSTLLNSRSNYPLDPPAPRSNYQHNLHSNDTVNPPNPSGGNYAEPIFSERPRGNGNGVLPGGSWLLWNNNLSQINYGSGMIGFFGRSVSFKFGMVESNEFFTIIKDSLNEHLQSVKQLIIQKMIQYVMNTKTSDPISTSIYDTIRELGNDNSYDGITDVQVFVIVGRLTDSILNQFIETGIRRTAAEWVFKVIKTTPQYSDVVDGFVDFFLQLNKEPDHLNIKFIETDSVRYNEMLNHPNAADRIKFLEPQVESNINEIPYTTQPLDRKLVHHIFNISLFTNQPNKAGEIDSRCHLVDPRVVKKIVKLPGADIFAKNNDGNTPLHIAVTMNNSELVRLFTERNLDVIKKFKNNRNLTPADIVVENAKEHLKFIQGAEPYACLKGFITQFNDLLLSRLKDPKFKENIVDRVSLIVPIQLIMYDHMFYTFVTNYRHGFTVDLKNRIRDFMTRHINADMTVYPTDIFKISETDIRSIVYQSSVGEGIQNKIYLHNQNKNPQLFEQLSVVQNQIDGLTNERTNPNLDQDEMDIIDQALVALNDKKTKLNDENEKQLPKQMPGPQPNIEAYVSQYKTFTEYNIREVRERDLSIVKFYEETFRVFGEDNATKVNIWDHYIQKSLFETPSMIILHLHRTLTTLVNEINPKNPTITSSTDFQTILAFMKQFSICIQQKNDVNQNLDDNLLLNEELKQIEYLINLIVTPAVYHIIIKYFLDGLIEFNMSGHLIIPASDNSYGNHIDKIINLKFGGDTISSYLTDKLPMKIIKHYTGIYNNGNDRDKLVTNASDLFIRVTEIFKENKFMPVPNDSILFTNFQQYLVPFFLNTYQNVINITRLTVHSYERYILNTYQIASIIESLF